MLLFLERLFFVWLVVTFALVSKGNTLLHPYRTVSPIKMNDTKLEHRFLMPLVSETIEESMTGKKTLLRFLQSKSTGKTNYDYNRDGIIDKRDLFFFADQWPFVSPMITSIAELPWEQNRGEWATQGNSVAAFSDLDARMVAQEPFPVGLDFTARFQLQDGISAGLLFWADASGETGFTVRLDSSLDALILSKIGPWPEEERLDRFPWSILDGALITLRVVTTEYGIRIYDPERSEYPILEAHNVTPLGNFLGFYLQDAQATYSIQSISPSDALFNHPSIPTGGDYFHIYDQSVENDWWYINDHCFMRGADGIWHLFGITHSYPPAPADEDQFAHATADTLTQIPWNRQSFALTTDPSAGEQHLWAPHIIEKDGLYYMFYAAGSLLSNYRYRIHLATSPDLIEWTRYEDNPLFQDYFDARDPMVLKTDGQYIMYYTALADRPAGNHIVAYRTSNDLLHWSPRHTAFIHEATGTYNGPTESPFVVQYEDHFYLLSGPDGDYRRTAVYRSPNPYHWDQQGLVSSIDSHAPEVIKDTDGSWYVSHCGWYYNGVYLAPLTWQPEPTVQFFCDLGESLDCVPESEAAFISDWRGTSALDLVADFNGYFILEIPISEISDSMTLEFEEQGEVLLEVLKGEQVIELLNEGNSGPAFPMVQKIQLLPEYFDGGKILLRFRDSDPGDGWGPNVNWIRIVG